MDSPQQPTSGRPAPDTGTDDLELAGRSVTGDRAAFEMIHRRYVNRIHGLCLRLTADPGEAEILTQDTFVRAWFALAGFTGQGSLGGWLGRVAVNIWRDRWRGARRGERLVDRLAAEEAAATPFTASEPATGLRGNSHDGVVPLLTAVDLERAIARLPRGARTVYVLHDVEGYTHREIGENIGVATGTVKAHLHRARRLLRKLLSDEREAAHGA
jgi:RNA polymerase sigma-70 factor (ECF subfamily)